jgi:hypothetical protein
LTIDGLDGVENVRGWTGPQSNAQPASTQVYSQPNSGATTTLGGNNVPEVGPYTASMIVVGHKSIEAARQIAAQCLEDPHNLDITVTEESPQGGTSSTRLLNAFVKVDPTSLTANSNGIQEVTIQITALEKGDDHG